MKVNEIFVSIDGEVNYFHQGHLTTFIRMSGCNLACDWCDTKYALDPNSGYEMSIDEIYSKINEIGCKKITITGGEPLLQMEELKQLLIKFSCYGYDITIETNGSIPIKEIRHCGADFIIDYKCQTPYLMHEENFFYLTSRDVIKFLISDQCDYRVAIDMKHKIKIIKVPLPMFAFAPVVPILKPGDLVNWLIRDKEFDSILNIQIHKIINVK